MSMLDQLLANFVHKITHTSRRSPTSLARMNMHMADSFITLYKYTVANRTGREIRIAGMVTLRGKPLHLRN